MISVLVSLIKVTSRFMYSMSACILALVGLETGGYGLFVLFIVIRDYFFFVFCLFE